MGRSLVSGREFACGHVALLQLRLNQVVSRLNARKKLAYARLLQKMMIYGSLFLKKAECPQVSIVSFHRDSWLRHEIISSIWPKVIEL